MVAKRQIKKRPARSAKTQRSARGKTTTTQRAPARTSRRLSARAKQPPGTITEAATRVVKSGAVLVSHASQELAARGVSATKRKLLDVTHTAALAASSVLENTAKRLKKAAK